jgi:hypothetical protein
MKSIKNLPIYVLSGALIFVGIASASQSQAAWSTNEKKTISKMQKQIGDLNILISNLKSEVDSSEISKRVNSLDAKVSELSTRVVDLGESVIPSISLAQNLRSWKAVQVNFLTTYLHACPELAVNNWTYGKNSKGENIYVCQMTLFARQYQ